MSREQKWQVNRPIRNKTSRTLVKECTLENKQNNLEWNIKEFSVWKAYKPVLDEEVPMEIDYDETTLLSYQTEKTRFDFLGEGDKLSFLQRNEATPAWNNYQHGNEAMNIHHHEMTWLHHQGMNAWQTAYKSNNEEYSVWKAYKPVLDKEEPMEIDDDVSTSTSYQVINTGCNVRGESGKTSIHKHENEAMDTNKNAMVWLHHQRLNTGQTVYEPDNGEFSVWKAYKPVLDKEEPMEIDDDVSTSTSYQVINTGCNVRGESGKPSIHKHENEAMDTNKNAMVWLHHQRLNTGQTVYEPDNGEFSVWKAYKPVLDKEEPMEIDVDETYPWENTECSAFESEKGGSPDWKNSIFEFDKEEPTDDDGIENICDKADLDISSPENFKDYDTEIPEDSDDHYLSDAEFEEWLQDYMQQLKEDECDN